MAFFLRAKQAAESLATSLIEIFPATLEPMTGRKTQDLRAKALQRLFEQITVMQRAEKLGLFERIVFARDFQNRLKAAGYSPVFIRQTMTEVLSKISFVG
jgi:hypothetical protein